MAARTRPGSASDPRCGPRSAWTTTSATAWLPPGPTAGRHLCNWITAAVAAGELVEVPANAMAAVLLALADGLMIHASVDPLGFRWSNVRNALATLLDGLQPPAPDRGSADPA